MADLTCIGLIPGMNQFMSLQMALRDELFSTAWISAHEWPISSLYDFKMIDTYMCSHMSFKVTSLGEFFQTLDKWA